MVLRMALNVESHCIADQTVWRSRELIKSATIMAQADSGTYADLYFVRDTSGKIYGPYTATRLLAMIVEGQVAAPYLVRRGDKPEWLEVEEVRARLHASGARESARTNAGATPSNPRKPTESAKSTGGNTHLNRGPKAISQSIDRWLDRQTVWTLRTYATIATFGFSLLALFLGVVLEFDRDTVIPIGIAAFVCLMIMMILNYACMLDPNSTWSARMREENKPWKPRHAQPTNDAATTSNATSDTKTASNPSAIPTSTTDDVKYYLEGDAWWDILRGGVSLAIGVLFWLYNGPPTYRIGTLSILLYLLPFFGIFYLGKGTWYFARERYYDQRDRANKGS